MRVLEVCTASRIAGSHGTARPHATAPRLQLPRFGRAAQRVLEEPSARLEPLLLALPVLEGVAPSSTAWQQWPANTALLQLLYSWQQPAVPHPTEQQPNGSRTSSSGRCASSSGDSCAAATAAAAVTFSNQGEPPSSLSVKVDERASQQQSSPPPPQQDPGQKHKDYYANVGDAIRTLREDIPYLFQQDLRYDIYREDIVFKDPNISFRGLKNYKIIFWSLRFHGRLFFKDIGVEVLRIWQPEDNQIKMRWKVHAVPRVPWEAAGYFDAISTYRLDRNGKIYLHEVDNVQLRDPPITNPLLYAWNWLYRGVPQQQQIPCPGSWFIDEPEGEAAAATAMAAAVPVPAVASPSSTASYHGPC